jgi:glucose-1-phosphate cytidylyltransferase
MEKLKNSDIPIVVLCGGNGILIQEHHTRISKALVPTGDWILVYHVIDHYYRAGFRKFFLASGYQGEELEKIVKNHPFEGAELRVVETGVASTTGDRMNKVRPFLEGCGIFGMTYSDTVSDVPLQKVLNHFIERNMICALVAANLPTRFLILGMRQSEDIIRGFTTRPVIENDWVNGGFYFFKESVFSKEYLGRDAKGIVLEEEILSDLAKNLNLSAYKHRGFWQPVDGERDLQKVKNYLKDRIPKP